MAELPQMLTHYCEETEQSTTAFTASQMYAMEAHGSSF